MFRIFKPHIVKLPQKTKSFLDIPLRNYSKKELDNILSTQEKEFAKSIENSNLAEVAESYHINIKLNK